MAKVIYKGYAKKDDPIYTDRFVISNPKVILPKKGKDLYFLYGKSGEYYFSLF